MKLARCYFAFLTLIALSHRFVTSVILLLFVFGTLGIPAASMAADEEKPMENEAAGWSGNMDLLLSQFTDDVIYEDAPLGLVLHGKEELRGFAQGFFKAFPDLKAVITSTVVSGNRAASDWRFMGTHTGDMPGMPASNKRMDVRGASLYQFEGGKIKRKIDYYDWATVLKQLGFMPAAQ
jgi:steroid delta-isomerase-like uncharacterized protein